MTAARTPARAIPAVDDDAEVDQAIDSMLGDFGEASWEDEHTEVGILAFEEPPIPVDPETVLVPALRLPVLTPAPLPVVAPPAHARELQVVSRERDEAIARERVLVAELDELRREHARLTETTRSLAAEVARALRALRGDQR